MDENVLTQLARTAELHPAKSVPGGLDKKLPDKGIYAWYFKDVPAPVREYVDDCPNREGAALLYIGISPTSDNSKNTLSNRLQFHLRGNAFGSTVRLSLGCLLGKELGIELRRAGSGSRLTFHKVGGDAKAGEKCLTNWIAENVLLCWAEHAKPWDIEPWLIAELKPPLNLDHNSQHPFYQRLTELRAEARKQALNSGSFANQTNPDL